MKLKMKLVMKLKIKLELSVSYTILRKLVLFNCCCNLSSVPNVVGTGWLCGNSDRSVFRAKLG